jgi:carbon storage regulator
MLVLSRKKTEEIVIGDEISIMVVEIRGDKVRIGIDAPKHIKVHRKEVWLAIQKETSDEQCVSAEVPGSGCV